MTAIRISEPMADTILAAVKRDTGEWIIRGRVQTENALSVRGLIDYGDDYAFLTPSGVWVLEYMRSGGVRRAWTTDELDIKCLTPKEEAVRDSAAAAGCVECGLRVADGSERHESCAPAATEAVTEYSVKIWYRSGAYEGAPHCPEELARKIFADAVKSPGVEFAELHGPSGMLVESKTPNEERPVSTEPNENLFIAHLPQLPEPLPPAPLNVSQHGEDLTAAYSAQDPAEPTA